jgi:preprotein translocase subunit SecG
MAREEVGPNERRTSDGSGNGVGIGRSGADGSFNTEEMMTKYMTRMTLIAATLFCIAAVGCSSMTPEEKQQWAHDVREVGITRDRARVEGCELLGETSGVYGKNVRQQVARMHGNVALITGKQFWWNLKVRYLAEAYRCPEKAVGDIEGLIRTE